MKLKVGDGATQHCVCPKFIMLTIFRGPSGEGGPPNGNEGGSIWKYHWSVRQCCETIFSIFVVEEPGIKLKFVWQFAIGGGLTKPRKTSNLTLGKSPRMRCGGNLSGGQNKQKKQQSSVIASKAAITCGVGTLRIFFGIINRWHFENVFWK